MKMSSTTNGRAAIFRLALMQFLILITCTNSSSSQQNHLQYNFHKEFLFTNKSNLNLPKGSYLIRVLVVGGGGIGCKGSVKGNRGKAGEVTVDVLNLTLSNPRTFKVTVGLGEKNRRSHASSQNVNQKSHFEEITANGGKGCGNENTVDLEEGEGFANFFMSGITRGRPGKASNTSYGRVLGGEGGILINSTGPEQKDQPDAHQQSSEGGEGYGGGGGSGGKHQLINANTVTSDGGDGAQGVVYIEVLPKVCRRPLRVFFALESGPQIEVQIKTVIGLLDFFTVSLTFGKLELMITKNQTSAGFKFGQYNQKDDLIKAIRAIQQYNSTEPSDYVNIFKTALKAFKDTDDQYDQNDTKTLVIFSEFTKTSQINQELLKWKNELRNMNVVIMVIGIAEDTLSKEDFLNQLASKDDYVYTVPDPYQIKTYWARFANMICRVHSYYVVKERKKESPMTTPSRPYAYYNKVSEKLQKEYLYILNYDITKADPNNSTEVKRIMTIAGEIIQNSQRLPNASQIAAGLKVIQFLEDYGLNMVTKMDIITDTNVTYKHFEAGNMGMTLLTVKTKSFDKLHLSQFIPERQKSSLRSGHVVLPNEAFAESDDGRVVWLTLNPVMSMGQANDSFISSKVMNIKVEPKSLHIFERPVELTFNISKIPQGKQFMITCEFWNNSKRLIYPHGAWSSEGCKVAHQNETSVSCQCNHLTSFAVLTRITNDEESRGEHDKYLSIITYVGCSLSILGCILTIIIHACLPSLRTERSFIHLNLVTAILMAQSLFFAAASIRQPKGLCFAIGIGLYFFYLSVFTWMLVEGLHIYCLVIRVFHTGHERKKLYSIIGWVLPAVMTIVCAASFRKDFISEKLCWLSVETGAIWSFVGPALVIIAINLIILVLVLRVTAGAMMQDEIRNNPNKSLVRACITLLPILGLTWLFGILAINNKTIVFEYLFCIFNSIQGLLIFLFYCIGSSEVRRECKRKLHNYETKRSLRNSSSGYKASSKQINSFNKQQSKSTELIDQKYKDQHTNDDTRL